MVHTATCPLCEASCGLLVDTDGAHIRSIRGDTDDPFSRGYLCPKAAALADLQDDPESHPVAARPRGLALARGLLGRSLGPRGRRARARPEGGRA